MTYQQSLDYLNSFINHEKSKSFAECDFSLAPMQKLVELLDLNLDRLKVLHIAGTKGKGSVAEILSDLLANSHYKVGVFSSPHIVDIRERIRVKSNQSSLISQEDFASCVLKIKKVLSSSELSPSYFELLTAIALMFFLGQEMDFVVLEAGLGGRLDATNVVDPLLSIITSIALEHTEILGDTHAKIAKEKAGIIKTGKPVFLGEMPADAKDTIIDLAKEKKSDFYVYGEDFWAENIKINKDGVEFDYCAHKDRNRFSCAYPSAVQAKNAVLVISVYNFLRKEYLIPETALFKALVKVSTLGRYTCLNYKGHKIIADIAHTVESVLDLRNSLDLLEADQDKLYILGVNKDKNFNSILDVLKDEKIIFSKADNPRALCFESLNDDQKQCFVGFSENIELALQQALKRTGQLLIVTGSAYLVADLIKYLNYEVSDAR